MTTHSRRHVLLGGLGLAATTALTGCTGSSPTGAAPGAPPAGLVAAIRQREAARPRTGRTRAYTLQPQATRIDLGGPVVATLAYGDTIPGPVIRADVGDELAVTVHNRLDAATSVHWHGIALRNDMDGAAPATPDIDTGGTFTYRFSVPDPGTYWAHPHVGIAITDYGLYLPVIVDDPGEPGDYDTEWVVVLDDWTDGVGPSPREVLDTLRQGGGMGMGGMGHGGMPGTATGGMGHMGSGSPAPGASGMGGMSGMGHGTGGGSDLLGGDVGDVAYPYYLVNGRVPAAPSTFRAKPGQRIRIRVINAGADTAFRLALSGHSMTVTHTDGYPVQPRQVDALLVGMGERYDVTVTAGDGVFALVALAEGKDGAARALLRTGSGAAPEASLRPEQLHGRVGTVQLFTATDQAALPARPPDLQLPALLGGDMTSYRWTINGRTFDAMQPLGITAGQRARLTFTNHTMMWHPMHLHGHTFQVVRGDGQPGPRKDTVAVLPMRSVAVEVQADNPGYWMLHCHNGYHMDAGMMTRLDYRSTDS
ncbi:MAG: multicopper oxidase family protein [Intrasporangium sp.]|uniref:multicopper oxidase family protein n=1 Tax=Intrasporangium sp. TaxID=1925024 RepID=UPI002649CE40|nr:multicopper oxidase family protein [Intrasporangium sp.]MDN5794935.1 multicopper oxidase family protein [Intrasporangium sp.]